MNEQQYDLLVQAKVDVSTAKTMLSGGNARAAASRAYYAMFYIATALLLDKNLTFSKHTAVISAFGKHFVREGSIPPEYHGYLRRAHELRGGADYDLSMPISQERVVETIGYAEKFVELGEQLLGPVTEHNHE